MTAPTRLTALAIGSAVALGGCGGSSSSHDPSKAKPAYDLATQRRIEADIKNKVEHPANPNPAVEGGHAVDVQVHCAPTSNTELSCLVQGDAITKGSSDPNYPVPPQATKVSAEWKATINPTTGTYQAISVSGSGTGG